MAKPLDMKTFWQLIGQRAIGATVVTGKDDEGPAGFLGLSATHVTADPPMMLVSIDKRTSALKPITGSRHFAINYLPKGAEVVADTFGGKGAAKGADRFAVDQWTTLTTGAPIFAEALAAIDCELEETIERHGVVIALGRVVDFAIRGDGEPLVFFRGKFMG